MILCREAILKAYHEGAIVIDPFEESLVSINSVDVRLGGDLFRLKHQDFRDLYKVDTDVWEKMETVDVSWIRRKIPGFGGDGLRDDDQAYILKSGEFYLGTTLERIGTAPPPPGQDAIVAEMKARSTVGRQGLTVALCAGLGDVGYQSRWALEIRVVDYGDIPLVVGTAIAQVVFHTATPTDSKYMGEGRYQQEQEGVAPAVRFLPKNLKVSR